MKNLCVNEINITLLRNFLLSPKNNNILFSFLQKRLEHFYQLNQNSTLST